MDFDSRPISERKTHQTGTVVQVFDNRKLDLDIQASDGRWETLCCEHSTVMGFETRANALLFAASPADWCEVCAQNFCERGVVPHEPSEGAANHFIEQAAYTNNGGGIADEGHLFGETDCGKSCDIGEGEVCPHGFLSAYDSAKRLGWLDEQDNITDKWSKYHLDNTR